ncbi:bidirectional sugar transporter SWEET1b [Selaginella moellendorffii]|uniref:bidirectional sugar transporter SWEET1b n=1 Tax=Selaginella moellendorffii TaxID=88036 RepID=UPI000D1CDB10|nr:bidirectional sugar transporter SWEET1b [Selaginella moellendorffii]|eukprot:XP_024530680.1 bidirectional sugar transporter SWEET1b [Selaginella moellendorffii]
MDQILHAKFIIGIIGNIATISTSLAPIPTFWRICKRRSTDDFSFLPYLMSFTCNLLWGWYALPFITSNNFELLTICIAQVSLQTIYILLYFTFTDRYQKASPLERVFQSQTFGNIVFQIKLFFSILFVGFIFAVDSVACLKILGKSRGQFFAGTSATIAALLCFASPLSIMGLVIKTKSVEYMPLLVSLALLFNCVTWTVYALLGKDVFLTIAEAMGTALAVGQLILYACYCRVKKPPVHVEESLFESSKDHSKVEIAVIVAQPSED